MPHAHVELVVGAAKVSGDPHGPDLRTVLRAYYSSRWSCVDSGPELEAKVDLAVERIATAAVHAVQGLQAPIEGAIPLIGLVAPVRA